MARWKARTEFLLSVIELLFLSLTVEALQGKMCQNSLPSGVGKSLGAKISGGRGRPWWIFFGFYKTRHILLSNGANCSTVQTAPCYVPSFWHNTGVWRTDGIAVASRALAMRALRRAVKRHVPKLFVNELTASSKFCSRFINSRFNAHYLSNYRLIW